MEAINPEKLCLYAGESFPRDYLSPEKIKTMIRAFLEYAETVNRFLDFNLVLEEAPKYRIRRVSFEDTDQAGFLEENREARWLCPDYARIVPIADSRAYDIHLNPFIDRARGADELSARTGFKIKPEEVYYFAFFHELGHTKEAAGALHIGNLVGLEIRSLGGDPAPAGLNRLEAERFADSFAVKKLKAWRRRNRRRMRGTAAALGVRPLLEA